MHYMDRDIGMKIIPNSLPFDIEKRENGKLLVKWRNTLNKEEAEDGTNPKFINIK